MAADALINAVRSYMHAEELLEVHREHGESIEAAVRAVDECRESLQKQLPPHNRAAPTPGAFAHILVGVSEKGCESAALATARWLAGAAHSTIGLVHVLDMGSRLTLQVADFPTRSMIEVEYEASRSLLDQVRGELPDDLKVEQFVREGRPCEQIVALAGEWPADVIVLGTHGGGRLARFLHGSTVDWVIRHAKCPVLVVDKRAAQPASA